MKRVPEIVKEPIFLKFVEYYAKRFKEQKLYRYTDNFKKKKWIWKS